MSLNAFLKQRPNGLALWTAVLLALGLILRLRQYLFNRSLWLDEAYLAISFVERDLGELLLQPLANGQAAPLGFLLLVKTVTSVLGMHDWSLRLVPLLAGVLSLVAAVPLARLVLPGALARSVFVGLMALAPVLVYYSSEFKQYQGDVLCSVLILWLSVRFRVEQWRADGWLLALAGAACIWFSHASLFVLAGAGTVLWLEMAHRRHRAAWLAITAAGLIWLVSFGLNHTLSLRNLTSNSSLIGFWEAAYAPFPPQSIEDLRWYWNNALGLVYLAMRHTGVAHHGVMPGWFDALNVGLLALTLLGCLALARLSKRMAGMALVTLIAVLAASALHLYPFRSRLILFLLPLVYLALAALVQLIWSQANRWVAKPVAMGLALGLIFVMALPSAHVFRHPENAQNIKGAMGHVAKHRQPGDQVVLGSLTHKAFDFYTPTFQIDDLPVVIFRVTPNREHDARATVRRICLDPQAGRSWLIISHRLSDQTPFLEVVNSISPPLAQWQGEGAAAFLHDFRSSPYCQRYRTESATSSAPTPGDASKRP
ncbi:glycosyltransferase family 39 protein [Hydrogenophaga sp. A37]|uniref:glycosyltransferase family 39 protein n=1 Tax=Hydrogenophaga sp. A37 TaxID=1945864 RepID=UPI00098756F1|nr:glycosyltransferase family 39 protein [Hydrogenophaga sp. A37]OOG85445.1 hypothetical protein B0E41_07825 [Hydrogenophaga sp. A37]